MKNNQKKKAMTREEEFELGKRSMNGDMQARNELVMHAEGLVRFEMSRKSVPESWQDDLRQSCFIGLMEAAKGYDPEKGRFSTYASIFVQGALNKECRNLKGGLTASHSTKANAAHVLESIEEFQKMEGRVLSDEEAASLLNITPGTLRRYRTLCQKNVSVDKKIGEDGDITLQDTISDRASSKSVHDVESREIQAAMSSGMETMLNSLTPVQKKIILVRFGFGYNKMNTIEETARICHVSKQYVNNVVKNCIPKLKVFAQKQDMEQLWNDYKKIMEEE